MWCAVCFVAAACAMSISPNEIFFIDFLLRIMFVVVLKWFVLFCGAYRFYIWYAFGVVVLPGKISVE